MDYDNLVQTVVEKVMETIVKRLNSYVLIGQNLDTIKNYLTRNGNHVISEESLKKYEDSALPLIIEVEEFSSLMRLSQLIALNEDEEIMVKKLSRGEEFYVKYSGIIPSNPHILRKFEQAKNNLALYGADVVDEAQLSKYFLPNKLMSPMQTSSIKLDSEVQESSKTSEINDVNHSFIDRDLITAEVVRQAYENEKTRDLKVKSNAIITALAKDFIRDNNINVLEEE